MTLPFFNLYVTDYEGDTAHLTIEEDGAYMRLLRLCWRTPGCSIPSDPKWIIRQMRCDQETFERAVKPVLDEFFKRNKSRYWSPRLLAEYQRANESRERRVEAGKKGGQARAKNVEGQRGLSLSDAAKSLETNTTDSKQCSSNQNQNHNHIVKRVTKVTPKDDLFGKFWDLYPRKIGKGQALRAWSAAVKKVDPAVIVEGLQLHLEDLSSKDREFTPHPATWLNGERWADELERDTFWDTFSWENSK